MKVQIAEIRKQFADLLRTTVDDEALVAWLTELNLDNELTDNRFNGFDEIIKFVKKGRLPTEKYTLDVDKPTLKLVNCHDTPAYICMKDLLEEATSWAKKEGQVFIGFHGGGYHEALGTIARKFAEHDLLCIYSANGGPQGVVPFGGSQDVMGTNPLAYGIPTSGMPIVFDAATAAYAYGTITIAKEKNEQLPTDTYLNKEGKYTTDPHDAIALIPFGEYKGYAINLLLEVMTAALVGGKAGRLQTDESGLGGFMLLIDPSALGDMASFKKQVDQLVSDIEQVPPAAGFTEVRVPGYRSQRARQQRLEAGEIEVDDAVYNKFLAAYKSIIH